MLGLEGKGGNPFPHLALFFCCSIVTRIRQPGYWQNPLITVPTFCGSDRRTIGEPLLDALGKGEGRNTAV